MPFTEAVREMIQLAMRVVTSADKAYKFLREHGATLTRDEVREAWREVGLKESWATVLNTWPRDYKPPRSWVMQGPKGLTQPYMYVFRATVRDLETGEITETYYSYLSQEYRAIGDIELQVGEPFGTSAEAEYYEILALHPAGIFRRS